MLPDSVLKKEEVEDLDFFVYPSNWQAYKVFQACQTQWRLIVGMSGMMYQGLDYSSVMAVIDALGVKKRKRVFLQVQLIEVGALSELNGKEDV